MILGLYNNLVKYKGCHSLKYFHSFKREQVESFKNTKINDFVF